MPKSEFGGFHRIEKALWAEETTKGMKPVAEGLREDVEELEELIKGKVNIQAVEIADGADELLAEVLDLEDHRRGGALLTHRPGRLPRQRRRLTGGVRSGRPADREEGTEADQGNRSRLRGRLRGAEAYETEAWPGFVLYTALTKADTRKLAQVIDTLAEKSSLIPARIAKGEQT